MTYYRITERGPIVVQGRDWDVCVRRVAGWYYTIDTAAGAGCRVRVVIDRATRRHYRVADNLRRVVSPLSRSAARQAPRVLSMRWATM